MVLQSPKTGQVLLASWQNQLRQLLDKTSFCITSHRETQHHPITAAVTALHASLHCMLTPLFNSKFVAAAAFTKKIHKCIILR
jgi:hypothetical protein